MDLLITKGDFDGVVKIADHCDDERLEQYILERQTLDLTGLLGTCFLEEVMDNKSESDYQLLINGGVYVVDGKKRRHYGIRMVLVHYVAAAYLYRGGLVDTPFSVVQKLNRDSVPVPVQELRNLHDEHRKMAYKYWKMTLDYLCNNKGSFECFDDCDCPKCDKCGGDCGSTCKNGGPDRTRAYRLKVIKK